MLKYNTTIILIFFFFNIYSQERARIYGIVTNKNNFPIELANITLIGYPIGTVSNEQGEYDLSIPISGKVDTVMFSFTGYKSVKIPIELVPGETRKINSSLAISSRQIETITIVNQRDRELNITRLDPKLMSTLPSVGVGGIESTIKTLPGVSSKSELSSQYSVRGGSYDENLVYINDIQIYRPTLISGSQQEGMSFLNSKLTSSISFSSGGFEAKYGDKMSSALDISYRKPTKTEASADLNFMGADFHFGGISKGKAFTHITGVRYRNSSLILNTMDDEADYFPVFADMQSYLTYKLNEKNSLETILYYSTNTYLYIPKSKESSYGAYDDSRRIKVYYQGQEDDKYQTYMGSSTFNQRPSDNIRMSSGISYFFIDEQETLDIFSKYNINQVLPKEVGVIDTSVSLGVGSELRHLRNYLESQIVNLQHSGSITMESNTFQWGVSYKNELYNYSINKWKYIDSSGYSMPFDDDVIELREIAFNKINHTNNKFGIYINNIKRTELFASPFSISTGLRYDYIDFTNEHQISPRLRVGYNPEWESDIVFRFATGLYYQSPQLKEMVEPNGNFNTNIKSQKSFHYILGADYNFLAWDRPFKLVGELYYKHISRLVPYTIENVKIQYHPQYTGSGYATGFDLKINGEFVKGTESWLSVSILDTKQKIEELGSKRIRRPNDQRVNVAFNFQDYFPGYDKIRMNLTINFGSRIPTGPEEKGLEKSDLITIPPFRRLDMGFLYYIINNEDDFLTRSRGIKNLLIGFDIINLLNIQNTVSFFWLEDVNRREHAVPNYLTSRLLNLKISVSI